MKITQNLDGTTLKIKLDGKLITGSTDEFEDIIDNNLTNIKELVIDCANLGFAWPLIYEGYIHKAVQSLEALGFFD